MNKYLTSMIMIVTGLVLFCNVPVCAEKIIKKMEADLDGDNKKESIQLSMDNEEQFTLKVNHISIKVLDDYYSDPEQVQISLLDINTTDGLKQIGIRAIGDSDMGQQLIFWFTGSRLVKIMELDPREEDITIAGNGIVYIYKHTYFPGKLDKYIFDSKKLKFIHVPQPFYYVGKKGFTEFSFPIRIKAENKASIIAYVKSKSEIELLVVTPLRDWYLIKTSTNLVGWASQNDIHEVFKKEKKDFEYRP